VLYSFTGGTDGNGPYSGLVFDAAGNLYGTTRNGGAANAGVVYKLDRTGHETVLYSFTGGQDGADPYAGVILDSAGNLYGTTIAGGQGNCNFPGFAGCGTVYKLDTMGNVTVLYSFTGFGDGGNPSSGVIMDGSGNLYGAAAAGGTRGGGVVFELKNAVAAP
jgi:uncharacterized repeat protein (TIGR03803 family)